MAGSGGEEISGKGARNAIDAKGTGGTDLIFENGHPLVKMLNATIVRMVRRSNDYKDRDSTNG